MGSKEPIIWEYTDPGTYEKVYNAVTGLFNAITGSYTDTGIPGFDQAKNSAGIVVNFLPEPDAAGTITRQIMFYDKDGRMYYKIEQKLTPSYDVISQKVIDRGMLHLADYGFFWYNQNP